MGIITVNVWPQTVTDYLEITEGSELADTMVGSLGSVIRQLSEHGSACIKDGMACSQINTWIGFFDDLLSTSAIVKLEHASVLRE